MDQVNLKYNELCIECILNASGVVARNITPVTPIIPPPSGNVTPNVTIVPLTGVEYFNVINYTYSATCDNNSANDGICCNNPAVGNGTAFCALFSQLASDFDNKHMGVCTQMQAIDANCTPQASPLQCS